MKTPNPTENQNTKLVSDALVVSGNRAKVTTKTGDENICEKQIVGSKSPVFYNKIKKIKEAQEKQ